MLGTPRLWRCLIFEYEISQFQLCKKKEDETFLGVYGLCDQATFGRLRDKLRRVGNEWKISWCVGCDFNAICFLMERLGANRMTQQMWRFNNFIESMAWWISLLVGQLLLGQIIMVEG